MKERSVFIYVLMCPHSHEIRYVGYTVKTLEDRIKGHMRKAKSGTRTHNYDWIRSLHPFKPIIQDVCTIPESSTDECERYWISYFHELGYDLTNHSPGGRGTLGIKWPKEVVEKRAAKLRGHVVSEETRVKISKANTGKKRTPEAKKKMSDAKKNRSWTKKRRAVYVNKWGEKSPTKHAVHCIKCRAGSFSGMRGLYRHYESKHDIKLGFGHYE